jgi:prefoldin subunit 4
MSIKVSWQDQQRINAYGRLTNRRREIEAELEQLEETVRTLEDASSEVTLNDEGLRYHVADCFVEVDAEQAEAMLEREQRKAREKQQALNTELAAAKSTLAQLRVELVRHFGDAIALDK